MTRTKSNWNACTFGYENDNNSNNDSWNEWTSKNSKIQVKKTVTRLALDKNNTDSIEYRVHALMKHAHSHIQTHSQCIRRNSHPQNMNQHVNKFMRSFSDVPNYTHWFSFSISNALNFAVEHETKRLVSNCWVWQCAHHLSLCRRLAVWQRVHSTPTNTMRSVRQAIN